MTPALGSEYQLEQATLKHFKALGWGTILAKDEIDGDASLLGRNELPKSFLNATSCHS